MSPWRDQDEYGCYCHIDERRTCDGIVCEFDVNIILRVKVVNLNSHNRIEEILRVSRPSWTHCDENSHHEDHYDCTDGTHRLHEEQSQQHR
ncbi:MAG: hypothetical protein EAX87_02030 [Candidatus Thorarchaeota archaeon]|nr:hypothetical protein [Candidatus Thorarchaeota archaeon]